MIFRVSEMLDFAFRSEQCTFDRKRVLRQRNRKDEISPAPENPVNLTKSLQIVRDMLENLRARYKIERSILQRQGLNVLTRYPALCSAGGHIVEVFRIIEVSESPLQVMEERAFEDSSYTWLPSFKRIVSMTSPTAL